MKLIKRLFIFLFALLLLGGVGLYLFIANFDANKYKPQIIEAAEKALGRSFDFNDIALQMSLKSGIRASIHDVRIGEDPAYGKGDFLKVGELFVGVNILDYLTKKEVSLTGITVDAPQITLIKGADGKLSVETIGKKPQPGEPGQAPSPAVKAAAAPVVMVKQLEVKDGALKLIDRSQGPETTVGITHIDLRVDGFSLTDAFDVSLKAAAFAQQQNVDIKGKVKLDPAQHGTEVSGLAAVLDLTQTDTRQLAALPSLKGKPVPEVLKGKLTVNVDNFAVTQKGIGKLAFDLKLTDGAVKIAQAAPGVSLDIPSLNASLDKKGALDVKLAYLSDKPNVNLTGTFAFDSASQTFGLSSGELDTDLSTMSVEKLKASVASLKDTTLPDKLDGKATITNLTVKAGGNAPARYAGHLALDGGLLKLASVPSPLEAIVANVDFTESDLDIGRFDCKISGGTVGVKGKINDYKAAKRFNIDADVQNVPLESLLDQSQSQEKAAGKLTARATLSGSAAALDTTLGGNANLRVTDGKLVNVNVLGKVLEKLPVVKDLGASVLPRIWQQKLQKKDTEITKFEAATTIAAGGANITPVTVEAEGFSFQGNGNYALGAKHYVLNGTFVLPADMSAQMASSVKEMQYLMGADKQIRFPLRVEGTAGGKSSYLPDIRSLVKNAAENKGKEQLMRMLDKKWNKSGQNDDTMNLIKGALGVKPEDQQQGQQPQSQQQAPASQQQQAPQQQEQQPSPEQQLMQGIMKGFGQ